MTKFLKKLPRLAYARCSFRAMTARASMAAVGFMQTKGETTMTYEEALQTIPPGTYRHFKGNEYEVIGIARHSEDETPLVVYRALYGEGGLWVRPAAMWNEIVEKDGKTFKRFDRLT